MLFPLLEAFLSSLRYFIPSWLHLVLIEVELGIRGLIDFYEEISWSWWMLDQSNDCVENSFRDKYEREDSWKDCSCSKNYLKDCRSTKDNWKNCCDWAAYLTNCWDSSAICGRKGSIKDHRSTSWKNHCKDRESDRSCWGLKDSLENNWKIKASWSWSRAKNSLWGSSRSCCSYLQR